VQDKCGFIRERFVCPWVSPGFGRRFYGLNELMN